MRRSLPLLVVAAYLALVGSGCTVGQFYRIGANSHFAYPNSNVKALGPVSVKSTRFDMLGPSMMNSDADVKLYDKAISQVQGANILIDYIRVTTLKATPVIPVHWVEESIEGTAARMEVGQQEIK